MEPFIGIIGAAVGILGTGLVNYFLNRQNAEQQRVDSDRREWLQRVERLHASIMECVHIVGSMVGEIGRLRLYQISDDERLKMYGIVIDRFGKAVSVSASYQRLFVPQIGPQWTVALKAAQEVVLRSGGFATSKISDAEMGTLVAEFSRKCMTAIAALEELYAGETLHPQAGGAGKTITPGISI